MLEGVSKAKISFTEVVFFIGLTDASTAGNHAMIGIHVCGVMGVDYIGLKLIDVNFEFMDNLDEWRLV